MALRRYLPATLVVIFLIYTATAIRWPGRTDGAFDLAAFGRLPVSINSRVQPIDSVARMGLLQVRGTVTLPVDNVGVATRFVRMIRPATGSLTATEWLLELMTKPDEADARRVFPIRDQKLVSALGLAAGPGYYAFKDLAPRLTELGKHSARVAKIKTAERAPWERELLKLRGGIVIYERLKNSLQPNSLLQQAAKGKPVSYDFATFLSAYITDLKAGVEAAVAREHGNDKSLDKATEDRMRAFARPFGMVARAGSLAPIPPDAAKSGRDHWQNLGDVLIDSARTGQLPLSVGYYAAMSSAYVHGKPDVFNQQVAKYRDWLISKGLGLEVSRARSEFFNTEFQPFVRATAVYSVVFVLLCVSWRRRSAAMYRSAAMLLVLGLALHTAGLLFDMMLEGRLPTTNLYSSIILAGWCVALAAAVAERARRDGIGMLVASLAGLAAVAGAHGLTAGGTVALFRAVLDLAFLVAAITAALLVWLTAGGGRTGQGIVTNPAKRISHPLAPESV
jgi:hypothetical protein